MQMKTPTPQTRLYVDFTLKSDQKYEINKHQSHYLLHVLRLNEGAYLSVFNGHDGEWLAKICHTHKKTVFIETIKIIKEQTNLFQVSLCFAPLKKTHTDILVSQATEMGVTEFLPFTSDFSHTKRTNTDRLKATATEAAELSERLDVPHFYELQPLEKLLSEWPEDKQLFFCDEARDGEFLFSSFEKQKKRGTLSSNIAFLIGPEGGFSERERNYLQDHKAVYNVQLGNRVMRADTAAICALSIWHAFSTYCDL